jgi:helix-turn-helix protein/cysteine-rich protein
MAGTTDMKYDSCNPWPSIGDSIGVRRIGGLVNEQLIANNLRAERLAAGFATVDELAEHAGIDATWCSYIEEGRVVANKDEFEAILAALGGIAGDRIYERGFRQLTLTEPNARSTDAMSRMWRGFRDDGHLLMSRDELNYFDTAPGLDHSAEVYVNMSCGTQRSPHLLQDTVSVLEALGISFVAAAGPGAGCCGKPLFRSGPEGAYDRFRQKRIDRSVAWGASVHVNWCGACQQMSTVAAARLELAEGVMHPVREMQLIPFLRERIAELGDRVPWKKEVRRHVIAEGHPGMSNVHHGAQEDIVPLLSMVPGVTMVGLYDGWSELSPCAYRGREGSPTPEWAQRPRTPEEIEEHRQVLADEIRVRGADTVACMHQTCHQAWSHYASERMAVIHPISVLAEALDCGHPDRFQEAVLRADPQWLLEESRPRWESWGMTEERAAERATSICFRDATEHTRNSTAYVEGRSDLLGGITVQIGDSDSFAMKRRIEAGLGCGGGCGGRQSHSVPGTVQLP